MDHEPQHLLDSSNQHTQVEDTKQAQQYRLADELAQKRLVELSSRDAESISDVSGELGLARLLAERSALTNPTLCATLLNVIVRLSLAAEHHAIASNELLGRRALRVFMQEIIAVVCEEIRQLPDADLHIDNIARRFDTAFINAKNEHEQTPKLLTYDL